MLSLLAFPPSLISYFFTQIKGGSVGPRPFPRSTTGSRKQSITDPKEGEWFQNPEFLKESMTQEGWAVSKPKDMGIKGDGYFLTNHKYLTFPLKCQYVK